MFEIIGTTRGNLQSHPNLMQSDVPSANWIDLFVATCKLCQVVFIIVNNFMENLIFYFRYCVSFIWSFFFLKRGQNWGRWKVLMSPLLRKHVKNYWGVFKCCNSKEPSWKKKVEGLVAPSWERLPLKFSVKKSRGLTTNFPALFHRLSNTCHPEPMW